MNVKRLSIIAVSLLLVGALTFVMSDFLSDDGGTDLGGYDTEVEETADNTARRRTEPALLPKVMTDGADKTKEALVVREDSAIVETLRVLVLDADQNPVTNARVDLREARSDGRSERGRMSSFFGDSMVTESLAHASTDSVGIAMVEATQMRRFRLEARTDVAFGGLNVSDESGTEELHPDADHVVIVQPVRYVIATVVTESGKAGGDLLISLEPDSGNSGGRSRGRGGRGGRGGFSRLTAWTDTKTGKATFEVNHESSGFDGIVKASVTPRLFGLEGKSTKVELKVQGTSEVTLTVPDTITVALALQTKQGEPVTEATRTSWTIKLPDDEPASDEIEAIGRAFGRAFGQNLMGTRTIRDGEARIGGFTPSSEVTFNATPSHRPSGKTTTLLPEVATDHSVVVELDDVRPILVLHMEEADGSPAARVRLNVQVHDDNKIEEEAEGFNSRNFMSRIQGRMNATQRLRTDKDGKLVVDALAGTTGSIRLSDSESFRGFGGNEQPPLAEVLFGNLKSGERKDMGTVTLDRGPLLVAGKVVDSSGNPVSGLRLSVTVTEETAQPREESRDRGGFGRRGRNGSTRLSIRTKTDGTFLAHRDVDLLALGRLSLSDRKWTMTEQPFNPGDENLLITVTRGGSLVGRVTKSNPDLIGRLSVSTTRTDEKTATEDRGRRGRPRGGARIQSDGSYTVENLAPGTYSLRVTLGGMEAFTQEGLRVYEAQETTVSPVMVGEGFRMAEVLVVAPEGTPLNDARVSVSLASGEAGGWMSFMNWGRGSSRTNEQGIVQVLIPSGPDFTLTVSSGRQRITRTVNPSTFPLTVNMKDATQAEPRRPRRSGATGNPEGSGRRRPNRGGRR